MSLYAIGDLHLSFSVNKPMSVFGPVWHNHPEKLQSGFSSLTPDDTCILCGDLSWGMNLEESVADFAFIHSLPGKKIILKGNHDYWWTTASKLNSFFSCNNFTSLSLLHNNFIPYGDDYAICGTRGWFYEEETGSPHDKKLLDREVLRLQTSLSAAGDRKKKKSSFFTILPSQKPITVKKSFPSFVLTTSASAAMAISMQKAVSRLLTAGMTAPYSASSPLTISTLPPSILTVFSIPDSHPAVLIMQGASFCTKYTKNDVRETLKFQNYVDLVTKWWYNTLV